MEGRVVIAVQEVSMTLAEAAQVLLRRARLVPVDADRVLLLIAHAGQAHRLRNELFIAACRNHLDSKAITHQLVVARNTLRYPDTARKDPS